MTPRLGTDGNGIVYPVRGIVQGVRKRIERADARTVAYVATLLASTVVVAAGLLIAGYDLGDPLTVLILATSAALAERGNVRLSTTTEQSISLVPTLFAAVLFGPLAAGVVGAASMLGEPELFSAADPSRAPRLKWATYSCARFLGGAATGLAATWALNVFSTDFGGLVAASLIAAAVGELVDLVFVASTARVRGYRFGEVKVFTPLLLLAAPLYAPVVALLTYMYVEVSPWTLALFLVPALAAQRLYGLYQDERQLAADLSKANDTLERANLQFAAALIATLDARDRYTAGHSAAVAIYSRDIASRMGLKEDTQEHAYLCGLVHDIGKIGLPPGLLEKPGALTLEERRQMQEHSAIGERILGHVDEYSEIATVVRHHHERIDGQGYPDGLPDNRIPLVSKIIAVADAYNAMTSDRPYRDAMPSRVARLRLAQAVDSQFDTAVVAAFEAILAGAEEEYRLAQRRDFLAFAQSAHESSVGPTPRVADVA